MKSELVIYEADGLTFHSRLYRNPPAGASQAGILVFPHAFGLGNHATARAERLAALGYAVLACDLHGAGRHYESLEDAVAMIGPLRDSPGRIRARAGAALDALLTQPDIDQERTAAIGYCFGGTVALELARSGRGIAGTVGFHCGLATKAPQDARNIKGTVLVCIGADDPAVDVSQRAAFEAEMRQGDVNWRMNLYGGVVHSFTDPDAGRIGRPGASRYDAAADMHSWTETLRLFDEILSA
ncbi:MAG: hypothetical protein QOH81_676 [Sphingomonadales bacterium]|jgi:dienelactone hydrolase|nr:hypothetical protein [Sphingomonadales bacterium]